MREDGDFMLAGHAVLQAEGAAELRLHLKNFEEAGRGRHGSH